MTKLLEKLLLTPEALSSKCNIGINLLISLSNYEEKSKFREEIGKQGITQHIQTWMREPKENESSKIIWKPTIVASLKEQLLIWQSSKLYLQDTGSDIVCFYAWLLMNLNLLKLLCIIGPGNETLPFKIFQIVFLQKHFQRGK